tara:strand:+ start:500 stop:661 length:162 start_codon:yes stop_codon:yes gene_type:complete
MKKKKITLNLNELNTLFDLVSTELNAQLKESCMPKEVEKDLKSIVKKLEKDTK